MRLFLIILGLIIFVADVYSQEPEAVTMVAESQIIYQGEGRDPFLPLIGPDGEVKFSFDTTDINIEGIVYDPGQGSMVLANGEFYKEGDTIGNANVISILKDRVILEQEMQKKVLWIREELVQES